jgi:protein TonB
VNANFAAADKRQRQLIALGAMLAVHTAVLWPLVTVRMPAGARPAIMVGLLAQVPAESPPEAVALPVPTPTVRPTQAPVRLPQASVAPAVTAAPPTANSIAAAPADAPVVEHALAAAAVPPAPTSTAMRADAVEAPRFHADYLNNPQPPYPLLSRRAREEGTVRLRVMVDANGRPTEVHIHASSGYERLDLAARAAVQEWRFVPARQAGRNVAGWVEVPIQFKLEK